LELGKQKVIEIKQCSRGTVIVKEMYLTNCHTMMYTKALVHLMF